MATRAQNIRCDVADPKPGLRIDRATLRKGRRLDDGAWVREAVLARADVEMSYSWGKEVATVEALSDSVYLDGLRGLALVAKHPGAKRVDIARPDTYREVGTVLSASWNAGDKTVVVEVVIRDSAAVQAVEAGQDGVSEGYAVPRIDRGSSPWRQLQRVPNHVALTLTDPPRMPGARLRTDQYQETHMELASLLALLAAHSLRTDSGANLLTDLVALKSAGSEAVAALALETARADAAEVKAAEVEEAVTGKVAAQVAEVVTLRKRADSLKVELPDDVVDPAELRKVLAVKLGGDAKRCDSADYASAVIDSAEKAPEKPDRFDTGPGAGARNDAVNDVSSTPRF